MTLSERLKSVLVREVREPRGVEIPGFPRAGAFDIIESSIYHRLCFAAGETPKWRKLFHCCVGGPWENTERAATLADTNMLIAGQLPVPQCFMARAFSFVVSPLASDAQKAECARIASSSAWTLWVGHKWFARGPASLNIGIGSVDWSEREGAGYQSDPRLALGLGVEVNAEHENAQYMDATGGVLLVALQPFYVEFQSNVVPETDCEMYGVLVGLEQRAVQ
jgi:hypothetical protein